jgi:hypothetical protein
VLHSNQKPLELLQVGKNTCLEQGSELTFAELVYAHTIAVSDGSDLRLRKWVSAFGKLSAWELETEQIDIASKAMIDHGYAASTVNRDVGTIGSLYKWAKTKRLIPKKFRSPSIGALKYTEKIRRVHVESEKIEALRARSLAVSDRRFGCYVALLLDICHIKMNFVEPLAFFGSATVLTMKSTKVLFLKPELLTSEY